MANGKVLPIRPNTKPQKATQTVVDTIMFSRADAEKWSIPPFQRPLRINAKVAALAASIKDTGVIPGVLTFGNLDGKEYLIDGQHRRQAFLLAEISVGFSDIRRHYFDNLGEMAEEFVNLNSRLVNMRPDDILRGLEASNEALQRIRKSCPFVGYDQLRRGSSSPIVSMSLLLRAWSESAAETPSSHAKGAAGDRDDHGRRRSDLSVLQRRPRRMGARSRVCSPLVGAEFRSLHVALAKVGPFADAGQVPQADLVRRGVVCQVHDVTERGCQLC